MAGSGIGPSRRMGPQTRPLGSGERRRGDGVYGFYGAPSERLRQIYRRGGELRLLLAEHVPTCPWMTAPARRPPSSDPVRRAANVCLGEQWAALVCLRFAVVVVLDRADSASPFLGSRIVSAEAGLPRALRGALRAL
ncbi:hypothetical protein MTO96_000404 [Rhipicephalus appendiculatus]